MGHQVTLFSKIVRYINRLGRDGDCESLTPLTTNGTGTAVLSSTQVKGGARSIKISTSAQAAYLYKDYASKLDVTKQYIAACWIYIESYTSGNVFLQILDSGGAGSSSYVFNANTAIVGAWQLAYVKIPTSNVIVSSGFRMQFGEGSVGTRVAYFDNVRLYEVSAAEYAAIGTIYTTDAQIDAFIPYIDSI